MSNASYGNTAAAAAAAQVYSQKVQVEIERAKAYINGELAKRAPQIEPDAARRVVRQLQEEALQRGQGYMSDAQRKVLMAWLPQSWYDRLAPQRLGQAYVLLSFEALCEISTDLEREIVDRVADKLIG